MNNTSIMCSCTSREEEAALPAWNWLGIKIEKGKRVCKDYVICHMYHPIIDKNPGTCGSAGVAYRCSKDFLNLVASEVNLVVDQGSKILIHIFQSVFHAFHCSPYYRLVHRFELTIHLQGLAHKVIALPRMESKLCIEVDQFRPVND